MILLRLLLEVSLVLQLVRLGSVDSPATLETKPEDYIPPYKLDEEENVKAKESKK